MTQTVPPALSQGYGYGIILGVGFAFAIFMVMEMLSSVAARRC